MIAIRETHFKLPDQRKLYRGKVRDVYHIGDDLLVMVASDRISAFDCILPRPIPGKGQILNQIAAKFLSDTSNLVPNWVVSVPDPRVTIGRNCQPYKVEMVIRGYLAGHAWREYASGKRTICGVAMPDGMKESDRFPEPIITPTIKASEGHDEDISKEEIISHGLVSAADYHQMETYTRALFSHGQTHANRQGLILVDTKYEFGRAGEEILLIDEIHTPDSSRYYYLDGYEDRLQKGERQRQLSKEFVREWLMDNGFQGLEGQQMPEMPDDFLHTVTERYVELYEKITGDEFKLSTHHPDDIELNIINALQSLPH